MRTRISRKFLAAIAAFGLVGAVLTPALVLTESASAAATYPGPYVGSPSAGSGWADQTLEGQLYVGAYYSATVERSPGHNYWSTNGSNLPAGLSLTFSGYTATVSGIPTTAGDASFYFANAQSDFSDFSNLYFNVTILEPPMTTVSASALAVAAGTSSPLSYLTPGVGFDYTVEFENTGDSPAYGASYQTELPAGLSYTGATLAAGWSCNPYAHDSVTNVTCATNDAVPAYTATPVGQLHVTLDSDYVGAPIGAFAGAGARNAAPAGNAYSNRVYFNEVKLVAPTSGAYDGIQLTAYAPFAATNGYVVFNAWNATTSAWDYLGWANVSASSGSASITAADGVLISYVGGYAPISASYYTEGGVNTSYTPSSTYVYIYKTLDLGGRFYLNGALYTDTVKLYRYTLSGGSGAFLTPSYTGGTYSQTAYGAPYEHDTYYMWAVLPAYGNAQTDYNSAGIANYSTDTKEAVGPSNFSDDMNFYWELAPSFTETEMDVPRADLYYSDSMPATSNRTITYALGSGNLPTGLTLNSTTGALTGFPTLAGEDYEFTINANIFFDADPSTGVDMTLLTATSATIEGTVDDAYTAPVWSDDVLGDFRAGKAFTGGVSADGNPTPSYEVTDGVVPSGTSMDLSTGQFSGTPDTAGQAYDFTITASNGIDYPVSKQFTGTVLPAYVSPVFTDDVLGSFRVDVDVDYEVTATGDPEPTFTSTGDVPSGITVNPDGTVTGAPDAEEDYDFYIVADTGESTPTSVHYVGTVLPAWVAPHWNDSSLEFDPQVGVVVDDGVEALGDGTITYKIKGGELPAWLTLDEATGALTGTPTEADLDTDFCFQVRAKSAYGKTYTWISGTVGAAPEVELDPDFVVGDTAAGAGGDFEITGAAGDSDYDVTAHSTPITIVAGTTSPLGAATGHFTIPSGLGEGAHSLVLTATAADGTPRTFTIWFTIKADGTIGAISYAGPITYLQLVTAGTDAWVPAGIALGLLALGGILLVRRRKAA